MLTPILIVVCLIPITSGHPHERRQNDEPICSKFDYEEKLLEKMIRMEMKMEKIIEEVKDKEKNIMSVATNLSQRVGNMENDAIQFQRGINRTMVEFADSYSEEKRKLSDLADKSFIPIVGFNARLSSTKTVNGENKVIFDTVITNQGEGYDSSTGIFTAPYTGLYFFSAHVCNNGKSGVHYAIYQEGTQLTSSTQYDNNNVHSCSSVSTIAMVNKAERVWVQTLYTSVFVSDSFRWNAFSGSLLNK
ncbi:complement C1q-like protein 4 isoform X1 [Ruditapes philippinarum]|uniref:complement C1q-like protein 4 isoform X1 n=1 Tax=Ruditapes philippinarum TaxID=129788 RepID=UPI00295C061B|nr:complement C1q-like protein 4 isoform X1 [Ruditapes philippinarum]